MGKSSIMLPFEEGLPFEALPFEEEEPQKSYMDRVTSEALPAVTNIGGDILRSIPAGIRGLGQAIATGSMEEGLMGYESSMEYLREHTPRFRDPKVEEVEQVATEGLEKLRRMGGDVGERMATHGNLPGVPGAILSATNRPGVEGAPLARTLGEVAVDVAPIPGVEGLARIPRARKAAKAAATEAERAANMIREAEETAARIEADKQRSFQEQATQQELPGFDELRKEAEPRTPYNMPESLRRQLEEELNPPVEQRVLGQQELFGEKPLGVVERPIREPSKPLDFTPEQPKPTTREGAIAQAQGMEATRPGAAEQLRMGVLDYPSSLDPTTPTKPHLIGPKATFRQGGVIDPDLLTFGIPKLIERYSGDMKKVLEKFKGTFHPMELENAIHRAEQWPLSKTNVVWMTPDEFHKLARPRDKSPYSDMGSEQLRTSIRRGLKKDEGLDEMPSLAIENGKVYHHEGRHRMDVFKEQGMDLIPVKISFAGKSSKWPKSIEQEYGVERVPLRDPLFGEKPDLDFTKGPGKNQSGAWTPFASSEKPKGPSLSDFKKELKARGINVPDDVAKAIFDKHQKGQEPKPVEAHPESKAVETAANIDGLKQLQRQYADRRPLEEVAKDVAKMPKDTLTDMATKNTLHKIIQGRFIAKDNPLLSWVSSQIHWGKQEAILAANKWLHGENGSRKQPEPGSFNYMWKQLKRPELEKINELGWALQQEGTWLGETGIQAKAREVIGRELSPKEMQAYLDRNRIMKEVLKDVNKFIMAEGREPIHELPHYWSPAIFDGPFLVKFIDPKTGDTVKVHSAYIKPNLKKLQKEFPDYKLEEVPERGLRGDIDWQQFEWILRQLNKEMKDPAARAINEGLRRMGFMKHGLKRKGVAGSKGSQGGKKGLLNMKKPQNNIFDAPMIILPIVNSIKFITQSMTFKRPITYLIPKHMHLKLLIWPVVVPTTSSKGLAELFRQHYRVQLNSEQLARLSYLRDLHEIYSDMVIELKQRFS